MRVIKIIPATLNKSSVFFGTPCLLFPPLRMSARDFPGDAVPNEVSLGTPSRAKRGMSRYCSAGQVRDAAPSHLLWFLEPLSVLPNPFFLVTPNEVRGRSLSLSLPQGGDFSLRSKR